MARTLKLDCITLSVTERGTKKVCSFDEFFIYKLYSGGFVRRPFADFFTKYVESFNGKFLATAGVTKAIHLVPGSVAWNPKKRTISGIVDGGNVGSTVDIRPATNATNTLFTVGPEHVSAEPFHFLLWMPADYEKGILLIQGYTNSTISDAFKQTLIAFFKQECPSYTLNLGTYVDKETVEQFMRGAKVNQVVFRRTRVAPDVSDDPTKVRTLSKSVCKLPREVGQ